MTGNGYIVERHVQLVADLEIGAPPQLHCTVLNPGAPEFQLRQQPRRAAKSAARNWMIGIAMNEFEDD